MNSCKITSKSFFILVGGMLFAACDKHSPSIDTMESVAKDKSQPQEIRNHAEIILKSVKGHALKDDAFKDAALRMRAIRSDSSIRFWIAYMKAIEADLPEKMPTEEQFKNIQKENWRMMERGELIPWNIARQMDAISECVLALCEYGGEPSNSEVDLFMQRFERKYGETEVGGRYLSYYKVYKVDGEMLRSHNSALWQTGVRKGME